MPAQDMYLLRGPDGRMRTVMAASIRGALKKFHAENPRAPNGHWDVKLRDGKKKWQRFKVDPS